MSYPMVGVVNLKLTGQKFQDADLTKIQSLLRNEGNITILMVDEDDLKFYIWGKETINYSVLDKIKAELVSKQYLNFVLSADEYVLKGQKYYYSSSDKT